MSTRHSRRTFLAASAAVGAGYFINPGRDVTRAQSANDTLNVAIIGPGGQGSASVSGLKSQNLVAFVEVDELRGKKALEAYPKAKVYADFRKMFDEMEKGIDAVAVCTPDHTHFHPAYWALTRKKHLYQEKPLAHNVWEVRTLTELAAKNKLATQLGNQRHALPGLRNGVELIKGGAIGTVTEVHSWIDSERGMPADLGASTEPPKTLNWDLWLGPREDRPYVDKLAPYDWRFWWEFGTGEAGNWGCHILDIPFWALDLKYPTRVSGTGPAPDALKTTKKMHTTLEFPASGKRAAVKLHWYQEKGGPQAFRDLKVAKGGYNNLFIGTEGKLLCGFDKHLLLPEDKFVNYKVPQTFEKSPGFHKEWINAIQGGEPSTCNFTYSGPMSEAVLLANIAYRVQGTFEWDQANLKPLGNPAAEALIKEVYKKGWEV